MIEMPAGATLPYFGGKRNLAPMIIEELGPHRAYCEPFMGSLAVLLAKPRCSMEIANDLWGHAVNLARVIASDRFAELADRVERTLVHEQIFAEAKSKSPNELDDIAQSVEGVEDCHVEAAYWLLVRCWLGRNGAAGTPNHNSNICRRFTAAGGDPGERWRGVGRSLPVWHERLRRVMFTRMDALEQIRRTEDTSDWAMYIDPPYVEKGAKYVIDPDRSDDPIGWHRELAEALNAKKHARVVLSYYPHPLLDELYAGWTRVEVEVSKSTANSGARSRDSVRATEVLFINGESYSSQRRLFA